jgi:hypothetical protein
MVYGLEVGSAWQALDVPFDRGVVGSEDGRGITPVWASITLRTTSTFSWDIGLSQYHAGRVT